MLRFTWDIPDYSGDNDLNELGQTSHPRQPRYEADRPSNRPHFAIILQIRHVALAGY